MTDPTFINDQQTTTFVARRITMQLDPADSMTLGRLQQFVSFALASGATSDELVRVDPQSASVVRNGTVDTTEAPVA